jgi:hypothetical protein
MDRKEKHDAKVSYQLVGCREVCCFYIKRSLGMLDVCKQRRRQKYRKKAESARGTTATTESEASVANSRGF